MTHRPHPARTPPPYQGGEPTMALFACERCGTGFVTLATEAAARKVLGQHKLTACKPEPWRFDGETTRECFKLLREFEPEQGH